MSDNVVTFPGSSATTAPIAQFIRVGGTHRQIEGLIAENQLPATRFVFEASRVKQQKQLLDELKNYDAEVVLDPQAAELSAPGRFSSHARKAPWAEGCGEGPLKPSVFHPNAREDVLGAIARMAVDFGFSVVLAPTHFLEDPKFDRWRHVDREACIGLRRALDREGGAHIAIDYPVIHSHKALQHTEQRSTLITELWGLPFDNLWIRALGVKKLDGPFVMRNYIDAMAGFHDLDKPVVADCLHGLTSAAAIAFGVLSGKAHGIFEHEQFNTDGWHGPLSKDKRSPFGTSIRIRPPALEKPLKIGELKVLAGATGGRRLISCDDRECCPRGLQDMLDHPRRHEAKQAIAEIDEISRIPDQNRVEHFITRTLNQCVRTAHETRKLEIPDEQAKENGVDVDKLGKKLGEHARLMDRRKKTLENYQNQLPKGSPRARPVSDVRDHPQDRAKKKK